MIKSLHIGRYVANSKQFNALAAFLTAIGFERAPAAGKSAAFAAAGGIISLNRPSGEHPRLVLERVKDVEKLLVLEVTNPDDIFAIANQHKLKILAESAATEASERTFWLELPGGIVAAIHGAPAEPPPGLAGELAAGGRRFAIVVSRFNSFITERLLQGALDALLRCGAVREDIEIVRVPGAFEIPSAARALAQTGNFDALICIGCVLRGDTAHYDVIVNEVTRGVGQSAQETGVPHAFGVLTCDTLEQAIDRAGLKMGNKGFEAGLAAVEMANLKRTVASKAAASRRSSVASRKRTRRRRPAR